MNDPSTPSSSPAPALVPPLPLAATPTPARPPRRFAFGTLVTVALLSAGLAVATTSLVGRDRHAADAHRPGASDLVTTYQCPMHPSIVQDHPGQCPICGMTLVKVETSPARTAPGKAPRGEPRILFYRSPMDARQTSPVPRKDEMGMDYLPVYESKAAVKSSVPGMTTVEIDPDRQQLIGLKITEVARGPVGGAWRTVGRIAMDETRVRHVNLKVPGFVEQIYVDFIGKNVRRGDRLFSLYSPELLASQEEYLLALKTRGALAKAGDATAQNDSADGSTLVAAARRKLALWDISEAEIDRVASTGAPTKTLTIYSPVSGVVTKKDVVEGMKLEAGAMPYEIVDLSSVWVLADVYESELRFVKPNMTATLRLNAYPNRAFKGKVVFIDPLLDPKTRTVKVRLTFPNPTGDLRPEMFGEVVLQTPPHDRLWIPPDAIIDSGTDKLVFVATGEGKFSPRKVTLGESDGSRVAILDGLTPGERVVTRANFLIDSESRLRASLAEMSTSAAGARGLESARVLPGASSTSAAPSAPSDPAAPAAAPPPPQHPGSGHAP